MENDKTKNITQGIVFIRGKNFKIENWAIHQNIKFHVISQISNEIKECFSSIYYTNSIDQDPELDKIINDIIVKNKIDFVIGHSEYDLIRSSEIRKKLFLPGQNVESAEAYRDKFKMKDYCRKNGILVAKCISANNFKELSDAVNIIGYPNIVKPVSGGGSRNTFKVTDNELLQNISKKISYPVLVEEYINGIMYHVDGLVQNGEIIFSCTSEYTTSCLAYQDGIHLGSVMLQIDGSIDKRMKEETAKVISALPKTLEMAFHAEFFLTNKNEIYLCEIASRSGGALVPQAIKEAYDIDINELWIKQLQGEKAKLTLQIPIKKYAGWALVPPKLGKIIATPKQEIPFDWLRHYNFNGQKGQYYSHAVSSVCNIASAVIIGESESELRQRVHLFTDWIYCNTKWDLLT